MREHLPRRWLIVDDHIKEAELIAQSLPAEITEVDYAYTLETAEELLKNRIYDIIVLDYYFKGSEKTGIDLIPTIRELFPAMPILLASVASDQEVIRQVAKYDAVFVHKLQDAKLLSTQIQAAAIYAQEIGMKQAEKQQFSVYLSPHIRSDIQRTIRNKGERVLLSGERGSGKTTIAQLLAANFIRVYYKDNPRSIIYIDCAQKDIEAQLFGSQSMLCLGAFERALGGALILDDVDQLNSECKTRLRSICLRNTITTTAGQEISMKDIKLISTISNERFSQEEPSFIASLADTEIDLPSISEYAESAKQVVDKLACRKLAFSPKAMEYLADAMRTIQWKIGFISLAQFINSAICHALEHDKGKVFESDFPDLEPYDRGLRLNPEKQFFAGKLGELFLYAVRSGKNYQNAQQLLLKLMMKYAMELFEDNKSLAARSLGISRSMFHAMEAPPKTKPKPRR